MASTKVPFQLGRYRCVEKLGAGGMAEIYRAHLETIAGFEKTYAIKKIHAHMASNPRFVEMFLDEAKLSASLDHGNVVRLLELNEDQGSYYMVMEFVDGLDLRSVFNSLESARRSTPWYVAAYIAIELGKALEYAHGRLNEEGVPMGIVHRDLSPSNVMLSRSGEIKILDFGIAKALLSEKKSKSVSVKGKWAYMSPEQIQGDELDGRSDIFALGALFYEMVSGRRLFQGDSVPQIMRLVEHAHVPPLPDLEPLLDPVLRKMLAQKRSDRFTSASELITALTQVLIKRGRVVTQPVLADFVRKVERLTQNEEKHPTLSQSSPWPAPDDETTIPSYADKDRSSQVTTLPEMVFPDARVVIHHGTQSYEDDTAPGEEELEEGSAVTTSVFKPTAPAYDESLEEEEQQAQSNEADQPIPPEESADEPSSPPRPAVVHHRDDATEPVEQTDIEEFMPTRERTAGTAKPRTSGRNMLILVLALLSGMVAGAAVYLVVARRPAKKKESTTAQKATRDKGRKTTLDAGAIPSSDRKPRVISLARTRPDARPDAPPASLSPRGRKGTDESRLPPRLATVNWKGVRVMPVKGRRKRGQLDLFSVPAGASVIYKLKVVGKTPIRLQLRPSRLYSFLLHKDRYKLHPRRVRMPRSWGREVKIYLKRLRRKVRLGKKRGTAIKVICRTAGVYRVYLNGRDTGYNCPVTLASGVGRQSVGLFLPNKDRIKYRKVRARYHKHVRMKWKY